LELAIILRDFKYFQSEELLFKFKSRKLECAVVCGGNGGVKFTAGYLYARKDIDFLQNFISEKLAEISKVEATEQNTRA